MAEVITPINQVFCKTREPCRRPGNLFVIRIRRRTIQQRKHRHFLTLRPKLARHFKRHISAKTITAEMIRPVRLQRANVRHILRRHFLDAVQFLAAIQAARFQTINRLIGAQMPRKIHITPKHPAARAMHQEKRRSRAARLNLHQRCARQRRAFLNFLANDRRQLLDRRRLKNRRHPQSASKNLFDLRDQFHREQRMAAEIKKFVLDADRMHVEDTLPNLGQLEFHGIARRGQPFHQRTCRARFREAPCDPPCHSASTATPPAAQTSTGTMCSGRRSLRKRSSSSNDGIRLPLQT